MEVECVRNGTVDEAMEVVHCSSCGAYMGRLAPGSLADMRCAKCKNEFNVSLRESTLALKRIDTIPKRL